MRTVLLAVDGSTASEQAARFLAHLPHLSPLDLHLVRVLQNPLSNGVYSSSELLEVAYERDKASAVEDFEKVAAMFEGANVSVRQILKEGNIGEALVTTAKEIDADLVVVGATGRSQISRVLLGSISDHVATHATCSVLVFRSMRINEDVRPVQVCLAYEGSDPAKEALEEITEIPWHTGSDLHVLLVVPILYDFHGEVSPDSPTAISSKANLQIARDQLQTVASSIKTHLIESEHIGEGIVDFAEQRNIDLMVVGESPRSTLSRFILGSTTRYVLRYAPCSVWIARNRLVKENEKYPQQQTAVS